MTIYRTSSRAPTFTNPVNMDTEYTLCDTDQSVKKALFVMSLCPVVMFDSEGLKLGTQGGSLSILSFRTCSPPESRTFLIDVLRISHQALQDVLRFTTAPWPLKVVFDGRMDYTEILFSHAFFPHPYGVLDLQIVDLQSRYESLADQQQRLLHVLSWQAVYPRIAPDGSVSHDISKIAKLNSLQSSLVEHGLVKGGGKTRVDHSVWLQRPLPPRHWQYAANDVVLIESLYMHFLAQGYILDPAAAVLTKLMRTSHRYITMWKDTGKGLSGDPYRGHGLLPMAILSPPGKQTRACLGCRRKIQTSDFYADGHHCYVCWILRYRRPSTLGLHFTMHTVIAKVGGP